MRRIAAEARSRIRTALVISLLVIAPVVGCDADSEPELPDSTDSTAIAELVIGSDGQTFLRAITSEAWDDGGQRAAELFAWIPRDAPSANHDLATRSGQTAHALASFLADEHTSVADAPANPALWRAYADSLIPYLGAMVGDERGMASFAPLDGVNSQMRRTATLFATIIHDAHADRIFTDAAKARAHSYAAEFAAAAVAEPMLANSGAALRNLLWAARLRGLLAAGAHIADPESERPTPTLAQTELAYQVASITARPDDPHINPEYFRNGRLLGPDEISDDAWSIYDTQLAVYLTPWPRIGDAIAQFGRTYATIATSQ